MLQRAASIVLALLIALAGATGATPHTGAEPVGPCAAKTSCCGGECQCGDACRCALDEDPASPAEESPALPERSRGERAPLVALHLAAITAVSIAEPIDLGTHTAAPSDLPAPPSCRLRLALVSRWTT